MMPIATTRYLATGKVPERVCNRHALSAPFGAFRTGDGHVVVAVLNPKLFAEFASVIGRPELVSDPRFATDSTRVVHEHVLREAFETWSTVRSTDEVVATLCAAGVPAARIMNVSETVDSNREGPQPSARPAGTTQMSVPEQPVRLDAERGRAVVPPQLDEHGARPGVDRPKRAV